MLIIQKVIIFCAIELFVKAWCYHIPLLYIKIIYLFFIIMRHISECDIMFNNYILY